MGEAMVTIRDATMNDALGRAQVHYRAWNETYTGLVDQRYLDSRSIEKCLESGKRFGLPYLVADDNGQIVGFSYYRTCCDEDLVAAGEVMAIYVLKSHQHQGVGRRLMESSLEKLTHYSKVVVWVLKQNLPAIRFYERMGFQMDSTMKSVRVMDKVVLEEIRMVLTR
jgi:ribosomal protein S18 acetylase RimI-like enzyme